jgi:hypothetical protein
MNLDFLIKDKNITNLSNFKTFAITKYYFEINSIKDITKLVNIYKFAKINNLKILFV